MESQERFMFQKRNEKIDWRKLAAVNVEQIAREIDVDAIQNNILSVTYCDIEHELGYHGLDPNFIKLFRLAQLTIEYLLHCQEYLQQCMEEKDNKALLLAQEMQQLILENDKTKAELMKRNESYKAMKKELQKSKKLIGDYQLMIRAGASGLHKCTCCSKSFVSEYYLRSHIERRHPEEALKVQPLQMNYQSTMYNQSTRDVEVQNDLNEIKSRLKVTEDELRKERETISIMRMKESHKNQELLSNFKSEHNAWKEAERENMKLEMGSYKELLMKELKQTQVEKQQLQEYVQNIEKDTGKRRSNLGDLVDADDSALHYQDLYSKIELMESKFSNQMNSLNEHHRKEQNIQKIAHNKKLEKEHEKFLQSENQRNEDKKHYEQQIRLLHEKITEHGVMLQESKLVGKDSVDGISAFTSITSLPPEPPPKEPDSSSFWVSVNQSMSHSHRIFRTPASTKGDWKDLFSFNALLQPIGKYQKGIYVYSCGGSPYWRQYVSELTQPPATNYKHDFTFYVSDTKLLGTMKLHVHEGGSGTVVRTTLSKEIDLSGWKYKGLSFYAMKPGPSKASISRSGTINSDIFESISDDDVSVSSFTGTDIVKDLADEIKRSREDLVDAGVTRDVKKEDNKVKIDEEDVDEDEDDDDEKESTNEHFGGTSSGSLLISTLPEKGEFYPFPNNPLAVARYKHQSDMIAAQRKEMIEILEDQLEKRGVDPDEPHMSSSIFKSKMKNLQKEGQLKEKSYKGFGNIRGKLKKQIDDYCRGNTSRKNKATKNITSAVSVVKSTIRFKDKGKENRRPLPMADSHSNTEPVTGKRKQLPTKTTENKQEEESDDEYDDEDEDDEEEEEVLNHHEKNEDDEFEVSDSSEWDSAEEDVKPPTIAITNSSPHSSYGYQQDEPYRPKLRPPQGEKVKELTASLEASLILRDPNKKKLAGAVDLYNTNEKENGNKSKRSVSFQDNRGIPDEDGESDFSLESDDQENTVPTKKGTTQFSDEDEDDIEQLLASYETAGNKKLTNRKPSASSTPLHKPASRQAAVKNNNAVTEFHLDDLDFDEDSF